MNNITITVESDEITKQLAIIKQNITAKQKIMTLIATTLRKEVDANFDDQGYPQKWTPLKRATIKNRQKLGYAPSPILQRSRALKNSFHESSGDNYAQISTASSYASIHHFGGTIKRTGIVRLRKTAKGLKRQDGYPNLAQFAANKHKRAVSRQVDYEINMPARPIIPINSKNELTPRVKEKILGLINNSLLIK